MPRRPEDPKGKPKAEAGSGGKTSRRMAGSSEAFGSSVGGTGAAGAAGGGAGGGARKLQELDTIESDGIYHFKVRLHARSGTGRLRAEERGLRLSSSEGSWEITYPSTPAHTTATPSKPLPPLEP